MSLAPAAYLIYQRLMRYDPADPHWVGRDRFVLSCGHSSLTQYIQLYYAGPARARRPAGRCARGAAGRPGHPEYRHTAGVEVDHRPARPGRGDGGRAWRWRPAASAACSTRTRRPGESPFDHTIWVLASDGDMEEGVTSEASSLAGRQQLGNLVVLYDQNQISIEGDTDVALSEDVAARYEAYGWHVQRVDWTNGGDAYEEDVDGAARARSSPPGPRPAGRRSSRCETIIAWPAPNAQNTGKAHGSALGADEVAATKRCSASTRTQTFEVADDVLAHVRELRDRGAAAHEEWETGVRRLAAGQPGARRAARPHGRAPAARRLGRRAADVRAGQGRGHPQGVRRRHRRDRAGAARALGRLGRPGRVQQHDARRASRASSRRTPRPRSGRATGTAGSCTSASASTRWARSSTASPRTAAPARTAARSSSSATTCARPSGWPRS